MKMVMQLLPAFLLLTAVGATSVRKLIGGEDGPVDKVVKLLEELQEGLKKDQKTEQAMYDKYACWCEEETRKKAHNVMEANKIIQRMSTMILKLKGKVFVLSAEITELQENIRDNEAEQEKATAIRQKENGEYMSERGELEQAISAMEMAIKVISGAGTGKTGLLQGSTATTAAARQQAVRTVVSALPARAALSPSQLSAIQNFASGSLAEPTAATGETSSASATIQGILKDMYDTFSSDLQKQTADESSKQRAFEDLIAVKMKDLNLMKEELTEKEALKEEASVQLADAMQTLDDTQKQMDTDVAFFDEIKAGCKAKNEEWMARSEARKEELEGIEKALEILTSPEAQEMFGKAIKPGKGASFLQVDISNSLFHSAQKAYDALKKQARKAHSLRLASLAAMVRSTGVGHFGKVLDEIDKLIKVLKEEEQDDIKLRDSCKKKYHINSQEQADIKWKIENNEARVTKLEETIKSLIENIEDTEKQITDTEEEMKKMKEERTDENDEFKQAKEDDQAAIGFMKKAVKVLSSYYEKNKIELVQEGARQPPDATFSDKGSRKGQSKGILAIMQMLIEDLQDEIKTGIKDEGSAQAEYEKQVAAAEKLVEDLKEKKVNLKTDKSTTEDNLEDENSLMEDNKEELGSKEDYKKEIEPRCDWMLDSFEERREKRKAEMEGMVTAKEYLSGMAPPSMLETGKSFNDDKLQEIGFAGMSFLQNRQ